MIDNDRFDELEDIILNEHDKLAVAIRLAVLITMAVETKDASFTVDVLDGEVKITSTNSDGDEISGTGPDLYLAEADLEESIALAAESEEDQDGEGWKYGE